MEMVEGIRTYVNLKVRLLLVWIKVNGGQLNVKYGSICRSQVFEVLVSSVTGIVINKKIEMIIVNHLVNP